LGLPGGTVMQPSGVASSRWVFDGRLSFSLYHWHFLLGRLSWLYRLQPLFRRRLQLDQYIPAIFCCFCQVGKNLDGCIETFWNFLQSEIQFEVVEARNVISGAEPGLLISP
jgi:hypothetical protein